MPRKEQTCHNCAGDCCSIVSFLRPDEASFPPSNIMSFTVKELKTRNFIEVLNPHTPCTAKSKFGCLIYEHRPRLCQSYYCHGRLWRAASPMNNSSTEDINPLPVKPQYYPELPLPQALSSPYRSAQRMRCK